MLKECVDTGRTVDEAIDRACEKLGYTRDEVQFEILDLPKKGFLGLGSSPAKVRVYMEASKVQAAADYLGDVLGAMGLHEISIEVREEGENAVLTLSGEGLGVIIGRRGETMDALQYLSGLVANRLEGDYVRITIDSGNYREKRERTLESLAKKLANTAVRTGRGATLEPMNPYERRIIHAAVATVAGATSSSMGEEPNRRVVISSSSPHKSAPRPNGDRGGYNRGRRPKKEGVDSHKPQRSAAPKSDEPHMAQERPVNVQEGHGARTAPLEEAQGKPLYGKIELE